MDIRVGKIIEVWKHADSETLYCEKIDMGNGDVRPVASGISQYVPIVEMKDAMVVVLLNLKPRKVAGFDSQGMVLCGETPDKSAVELIVPPDGC